VAHRPPTDPGDDLRFGFTGSGVFLNHASVSPPCRAARRVVHEAADGIAAEDDRFIHSRATSGAARDAFAGYVGSRRERVMCFLNTSAALSSVAWGLRWRPKDEVLVSPYEFVSNVLAWQLQGPRGVRVRPLRTVEEWIDPSSLRKQMTDRTRVVAVSAVHWATGARQDLRALAEVVHERDALLVVDAAQSLGAAPHSQRQDQYDVLATNTYKWLLSYNGTAFADFSKSALEAIDLASVGWLSVAGDPEPEIVRGGRPEYRLGEGVERFLGGAPSALSNLAATAALQDLGTYGQARIRRESLRASGWFLESAARLAVDVATPVEPEHHAGIVALKVPKAPALATRLRSRGFRVGSRGGYLRASPFFYTTESEADAFERALRQELKGRSTHPHPLPIRRTSK
jgi:cysteine desulfurase / selenocysteine lyase